VPAAPVAVPLPLPSPVLAQEREDAHSSQLREALQRELPSRMWERFFAPSAYLFADPGLKVICPNQSVRDWLETHATVRLRKAGGLVRPGLLWVTFEVEVRTRRAFSLICGGRIDGWAWSSAYRPSCSPQGPDYALCPPSIRLLRAAV
jgi:hypothetical protein